MIRYAERKESALGGDGYVPGYVDWHPESRAPVVASFPCLWSCTGLCGGVSPALPVVSGTQVVSALVKTGFVQVSQRGSHVKLRKAERVAIQAEHPARVRSTSPSTAAAERYERVMLSVLSDWCGQGVCRHGDKVVDEHVIGELRTSATSAVEQSSPVGRGAEHEHGHQCKSLGTEFLSHRRQSLLQNVIDGPTGGLGQCCAHLRGEAVRIVTDQLGDDE